MIHSATAIAWSWVRTTWRRTRRMMSRISASPSTASGHGSTTQCGYSGVGGEFSAAAFDLLVERGFAHPKIPGHSLAPFVIFERRQPGQLIDQLLLVGVRRRLLGRIGFPTGEGRNPIRRLLRQFQQTLGSATGRDPVNNVALIRQIGQPENTDAPGDAGKRSSHRVDVGIAVVVIVGHQDDVGVAEQLGVILGTRCDVGRWDAPCPEVISFGFTLGDEHRRTAHQRLFEVRQAVRDLSDITDIANPTAFVTVRLGPVSTFQ
jgi:hypothetical protein